MEQENFLRSISLEEARELIAENEHNDGFVIIDVRTPGELESGVLGRPINIDFHGTMFLEKLNMLDREKTYLVYCRSGNRSGQAAKAMKLIGFKRVYELRDGLMPY